MAAERRSSAPEEPETTVVSIEGAEEVTLRLVLDEVRSLRGLVLAQGATIARFFTELKAIDQKIDDVSIEIHDTHEIVKSIRNEQISIDQVVADAALMREIRQREERERELKAKRSAAPQPFVLHVNGDDEIEP